MTDIIQSIIEKFKSPFVYIPITLLIILYLAISFVTLELDFTKWEIVYRVVIAFFGFTSTLISLIISSAKF